MSLQDPLNTDERDWSAPTHAEHTARTCRGCGAILAHGDPITFWNGWPWCAEPCYRQMVALSLTPEQRELERAAQQDIERDDFNISRR